jgi:hypothetical protein
MRRFPRPQCLKCVTMPKIRLRMLLTVLLGVLWAGGCARPNELRNSSNAPPAGQPQVPFHDSDDQAGRPADWLGAHDNGPAAGANLPFHDPQNLPAGTLLTVRLNAPISSDNPAANATFEAIVDQPVVIEGNKLIPRGAVVSGRVESARTSNLKRNRGYVRLVLESIHLSGASLPVQTASLFVRGSAADAQIAPAETPAGAAPREMSSPKKGPALKVPSSGPSASGIRLEKGRLLTFRLTEAVYVAASQRTPVDH